MSPTLCQSHVSGLRSPLPLSPCEGTAATYPLGPSGETTIPKTSAPARFFRLRVTER